MPQLIDRTGQIYGRLTVLSRARNTDRPMWLCRCKCGVQIVTSGSALGTGKTKSCGCLRKDKTQSRFTSHGLSSHPLYVIWAAMVGRCKNPANPGYPNYGGRGIKCLLQSPQDLEDAIGPKPSPQLSVDRINNAGHYEPGNLRWATSTEQNRNQSSNRILTWQGESQCLAQWADELGISHNVIRCRLNRGWTVERALSTPTQKRS